MFDEHGNILTSADLDECHGGSLSSTDARYVYRSTADFPYLIGCLRGEVPNTNLVERARCIMSAATIFDTNAAPDINGCSEAGTGTGTGTGNRPGGGSRPGGGGNRPGGGNRSGGSRQKFKVAHLNRAAMRQGVLEEDERKRKAGERKIKLLQLLRRLMKNED